MGSGNFACVLLTFILAALIGSYHTAAVILAGVTIKSPPFVYTEHNRFSGFCIDLLNEIQARTGLNYSLYLVGDNRYGPNGRFQGEVSGLIGDVYNKKADFAIADLTVTKPRQKYVQFTVPFFTFSFSALVRKSLSKNLRTVDDLAVKSNLSIGMFENGKTMIGMQDVRKEIRNVRWLYTQALKKPGNQVHSLEEGLRKVRTESYAFLQEEPQNLYLASQDCDLKVLHDQNFYMQSEYAIAFQRDSPFIGIFNKTIRRLSKEGTLERLKRRYFGNQCNASTSYFAQHFSFWPLYLIMISLFVNLYQTTY